MFLTKSSALINRSKILQRSFVRNFSCTPAFRSTTFNKPTLATSYRPFCTEKSTETENTNHSPVKNADTSVQFALEGTMLAIFTCTVCNTRHSYQFSKTSYKSGFVIVKCPGCSSHHLVADNLGWFSDKKKNLETICAERGIPIHKVAAGSVDEALETLGFSPEDATETPSENISGKTYIHLSDRVIQAIPKDKE